jgi:hypothetical protein
MVVLAHIHRAANSQVKCYLGESDRVRDLGAEDVSGLY